MTDTLATSRRVVLQFSSHHVDVLVPDAARVSDALRSVGVDPSDPDVLVVASDGAPIDTASLAGDVLGDGSVVHVTRVGTPSDGRRPPEGWAEPDRPSPRPQALALVLAATCAVLVLCAAVLPAGGEWPAPALAGLAAAERGILSAALVLASVGLALRPVETSRGRYGLSVLASALLACAGAACAVDVALPRSHHLALVAGLLGAGAVSSTATVAARLARRESQQTATVVAVASTVSGAVGLLTLFAGLPLWTVAALLLGVVPALHRTLPGLALRVPEELLVDAAHVARTALSVRGPLPRPSPPLRPRTVSVAVRRGERLVSAGTLVLSAVSALGAPVVLVHAGPGHLERTAGTVLVVLVTVSLLAVPRIARPGVPRTAPRVAAAVLAMALAVRSAFISPEHALVAAAVLVALGLTVAIAAVLVDRGRRSVGLSRAADAFEALAVALALPAALVAVGTVEQVRSAFSG
ncbi:hypothetical protein [Sanguibacter suaedae]|uniref:Uncharacterized protein n=1 Tax=Sanguibacter suaedae TaxID=2795737 RepID=A0A934I2G4_9MICO|nr:hypothetical protein [Sanguibacter suaedae]MBI9114364.1 hypothetical protein [Sanguibacter suaedae]